MSSRHDSPRDFVGYLQKSIKLAFLLLISAEEDKAARFYHQENFQSYFPEEAKLRRDPFTRPEVWGLGKTVKLGSGFCLPDRPTLVPNAACIPLENDNRPRTLASHRAFQLLVMTCSDNSVYREE